MLTELESGRPDATIAVACIDVGHRRRKVRVDPLPDQRVLTMVPPGEVAEFDVVEAERLWDALRALMPADRLEPAPVLTAWGSFSDTVCCADAVGRPRAVTVATTCRGRVRVVAPAGGVAVFRAVELMSFAAALRVAVGALRVEAAIA